MKRQIKTKLKGKNKFIRLEDKNLKFVVDQARIQDRSQNYVINGFISEARVRVHGSNGR